MSKKQLLIIWAGHSDTGSTATIAGWIAKGASKYVTVIVKKASDTTIKDVADADGYALGSGVYNGNPEPDMLEFSENVLNAGKNAGALDLSDRFLGTFCTSGGYVSGAQPTLNALARILMTFGASHIGGGNWKSGQGVCGMVKDDKDGINWAWNPSMKYIQEDSTDYGERLGALASFYQDSYNNAMKNPPTTPQKVIKCNGGKKCGVVPLLLTLMGVLVLVLIILFLINKK